MSENELASREADRPMNLLWKPWVLVIGTVFAFLVHLVWLEDRKIDRKLDWKQHRTHVHS